MAHSEVGAVEVSRLSRSSEDWRRLLTLCALAEVAVIDEQTIYDRGDKDDKLLLELKGTMSEAELHWLGLRLTGARRNKARRGALHLRVPTGYTPRTPVYRTDTPPLASNPLNCGARLALLKSIHCSEVSHGSEP